VLARSRNPERLRGVEGSLAIAHRAGTHPEYCYSEFLPYLVLLRVGFAVPCALLPRRCALTAPFHPCRNSRTSQAPRACACLAFASGSKADWLAPFTYVRRYIFCGTFRRATSAPRQNAPPKHPSRTLSGTLLYGVRTFLSSSRAARENPASAAGTATIRPDIHSHIIR